MKQIEVEGVQCGIYKILNIVNNKFYIGSSVNIGCRKSSHLHKLKKNKHSSPYLQNSYNKYGEMNFKSEVLELCNRDYILEMEQRYIDNLLPEYNMCPVAGSCLGYIHTEETKKLQSDVMKKIRKNSRNYSTISNSRKLSIEQVLEIKNRLLNKEKGYLIAKYFSIDPTTVSNIKNNKYYAEIN